jgi:hypothetical protein
MVLVWWLLISLHIGKMGKDFPFYPNWYNFTEFLAAGLDSW